MIYVVRHGQTDWNAARRIQGRTDIPLNEVGRQQAERMHEMLSDVRFSRVFASPLARTVETARIISGRQDVQTDERLTELGNGKFEGMTVEQADVFRKAPDYDAARFGVESREQIAARVKSFMDECLTAYPNEDILIVTHGGTSIFMRTYFEGEPTDGNYTGYMLGNCEVYQAQACGFLGK